MRCGIDDPSGAIVNVAGARGGDPDTVLERVHVLFVLQPHFSLVTFSAAADALVTANLVTEGNPWQVSTLGFDSGRTVSDLGIALATDYHLSDATVPDCDVIVVVGGLRCDLDEQPNLTRLLRHADRQGAWLGGLWNGVIPLAHAGLMESHEAALHPDDHAYARRHFSAMRLPARSVVVDRRKLSAAGPNSSLDLMLTLIQRRDGADTVQAVRDILRADAVLPTDVDEVIARDTERQLPEALQSAVQLMRNNLDETLSRQELSSYLGMSIRGMERLFQKHLRTSPARFYQELRLVRARQLLLQGNEPIADVALACGFVSAAHFSRSFSERFGCSPRELRRNRLLGSGLGSTARPRRH